MTIKEINKPALSATKRELLELLLKEKREKARAGPAASGIPRRRPGEPVPAAFAQQRLWFLDQLEPGSAAYNIPAAVRLAGDLDVPRLERAVNEVVQRHEDLRTTFTAVDGKPFQEIAAERHLPLAFEDLSGAADPEREALRLVAEEAGRSFDLARGPLLRVTLFRLGEGDHVLLKVVHHIISDVWSIGLFFREMTAVYQALGTGKPAPLPDLPIQYGDYAVWQRGWLQGEESRKQLAYWKKQLTGAPAVLDLPTDRPRPPLQTFRGARRPLRLGAGLMGSLQAFGQGVDASLFMVLQAALAMLLRRYTGQEDVLTGTPMANRTRVELEKVIGFFVNMLVLRTDLSADPTFTELVGRVREATLAAYASHDLPLETVLEELQLERDPSRNPLFQVSFAFQNAPVPPLEAPGLTIRPFEIQERTSRFDLELDLREVGDGYGGWFGFNSDLFEPATIERMAGHFETLLARAAADPGRRISELSPLSEAEERQLLVAWNEVRTFPADATLHGLFERRAAATPEAVAVSFEDRTLTYGELAGRAESLTRHLRSLGVGPEVLVGLCLERSPEMIVGLLAVLKAGGAYLPLDPDYPHERLAFMLADSGAAVLLTRTGLELPETIPATLRTVYIDQEWETGADRLFLPAAPGNLAYVIYTSGSTGRPKGVQIPHANVVRLFSATQDWFGFGPSDVWTLFHSYAFDFSVWEIWGALLYGGRLVVVPYFVSRSPEAFAELLAREGVTVLSQTPSAFRQLVQAEVRRNGPPLALRHVIFGGEALELQSLRPWFERSDLQGGDERPRLVNMYGITETTVHVTYRSVTIADLERPAASPIGERIPDLQLFLLDCRLQPAPLGVPGEIFVGGAGLARGYLARPELTAERFVPHPFGADGERLYRSGDQARFRPDGDLEYLGRIDQQVKVRGFRIEIGEIEAALARVPAVREHAVLARRDAPGDTRLVAYVVGEETDVSRLRAALQERLPDYMVPSAFVFLPALPLNANGKVDRKALPAPESARPEVASEYVAPRTPVERDLARIWEEVLGVEQVGMRDSFFELGGQSLLATQVASRLREAFGVELPLRVLFQQPTLEGLAQAVDANRAAGPARQAPPLVPVPREGEMPLSFGQERLWFIDQLVPDLTAYNIPGAVRMRGRLVLPALEASVAEIMRRHEVLRTTFKAVDGRPVQVFHEPGPFRIPLVDLRALPEPARGVESDRLANGAAERGFDLENGPLLRILLLHLGEDDHRMALVLHHIVYDMWSREIFLRELATLYTAFSRGLPSPLPEPALQYADFAHWQRLWFQGEVMEEQLGYWRRALANLPAALELPTDRPRPPFQTFRGTRAFLHLTPELTAAAHALAQREGVTLFIALLTVYYALLFRYTGQADLPVGSPIANRNRLELEELMGFFANTLVLRADLSGGITFREALGRVREVAFGAYANQDLAFEQLVNDLQPERDLGRQPLFQVMFNVVQNYVPPAMVLPDLTLSPEWIHGGEVQFDFTLSLWEADGCLHGALDYSTELFDEPTVLRMLNHYGNLLESAAADPGLRLGGLRLLDEAERQQIQVEWNDSAAPLLPHAAYAELFAEAAVRRADAVALSEYVDAGDPREEIRYTYRELDERAGRWARRIAALGAGPDRIVALLSRRGADLVTAIIATLKSGAAYLPLDPGHPARRHAQILSQSGAILVLSAEDLVPVILEASEAMPEVPEESRPPVLSLRDLDLGEMEEAETLSAAGPENLAYVIYTSGSTGVPKGVMLRQEGLLNHLLGKIEMLGLGDAHTVAQNASQCFDISVWQMLGPLATGGRVHVYPDEVAHDPARLLDRAEADGVTILEVVPSLLRAMLDEAELRPAERRPTFDALRWVLPTGEALPPDLTRRWLAAYPEVPLVNAYGPTECSDDVSLAFLRQPVPEGAARVSIGRPVVNLRLYVMDRELTGAAIGVGGELCISGVGVGRGYRNDPARTASVFVPDPFSGIHAEPGARMYRSGDLARTLPDSRLEFLGRIDHQVKVRGFRIELGEIEAALAMHPAVREVAVLARSAEGESTTASFLAAYLVERDDVEPVDDRELREYLRVRLPEYMVPSVFVRLPALPLTPNGKLDRRALLQLGVSAPESQEEFVAPRTPVEERLAAIWSEVLGRERVSVTASFFELGGHSLLVTQVVSRLRAAFGVEMPLRTMFEAPTVAALAERVETLLWVAQPQPTAVLAGPAGENEEEGEL